MWGFSLSPNKGNPMGGGHSHWKVVRGCAAVMTPFFQASRLSLAYQFTINVQLMCPHFQLLEKFYIFSLVLAKISAVKMQIFQILVPKTPHFSRKIPSLDPTNMRAQILTRMPCVWHALCLLQLYYVQVSTKLFYINSQCKQAHQSIDKCDHHWWSHLYLPKLIWYLPNNFLWCTFTTIKILYS